MASPASQPETVPAPIPSPLTHSDFEEWQRLFRDYIAWYPTTLPDEQYRKTFDRMLDPSSGLYGLLLRDTSDEKKLVGFVHCLLQQTPWSERSIMHLNDLYIDPTYQSRGYGRALIRGVEAKAKELQCLRVGWVTRSDNPARKLYDKIADCNFVEYRLKLE
ncbi:acyl-CoA N-acyltransferase [Myriangium duriaei CBS 260.36]|uniref:Acyl-CoA N-acyltransferase n=1 Tax=Myriangium duriaei CBS 260.36 TaxID=1168546 RepID=A0A9P4MH91_9PEZI|nr:acyl-CoA N-acyltransferase [Myriangium duriaei CBS 260.36]